MIWSIPGLEVCDMGYSWVGGVCYGVSIPGLEVCDMEYSWVGGV